ncbi:MAG: TonB-dependent receptor [Deltaproteobacteria bacterium]|nr:TonB-dependent receptor [Deltaproteobacteria bacterium]
MWVAAATACLPAHARAAEPPATDPTLTAPAEPVYPSALRGKGLGGAVVVELTVGVDGAPRDVQVFQSAGPEMDAAAVEAAGRLRFAPATRSGKPVAARIRYRFVFAADHAAERREAVRSEGRFDRRDLERAPAGAVQVRGVVREKGTRRPVRGLMLVVDGGTAETTTDADGAFQFALLAPGTHRLQSPAGEYRPLDVPFAVANGKVTELQLRAERVHYGLYRATAEAPPQPADMARRELAVEEIQRVPGVYGDAMKVVQNLPGVARPSPLGGEVVVRGSAPSDSLAMIEGMRIPLAYHFGGLYSVVNTDMLEAIDFVPGGYPVAWGRQTGGVLNARLRMPRADEPWAGYIETNVFHSGFFLKGSVGQDTSFAVAARRSYIDVVLNAVVPEGVLPFTLAPRYWDWQARLDRRLGPRTWLTVFGFGSDDRLEAVSKQPLGADVRTLGGIKFGTAFHGGMAVLRHDAGAWTSKTMVGLNWGFSGVEFGRFLRYDATALDLNVRHEMSTAAKGPLQLRAGLDLLHTPIWAEVYAPSGRFSEEGAGQSQGAADDGQYFTYRGSFSFFAPALWYDAIYRPTRNVEVVPGVRFDLFRGVDRDQTLSPRLNVRWRLSDAVLVKAASGAYSQRPQPYETVGFGAVGNPNLQAIRSVDAALGTELQVSKADTIDVQVFYKKQWNLVVQAPGLFPNPPYVNNGEGRVYGMELLARHRLSDNWFGWIAYTLLWAERRDLAAKTSWRPFDWDQRHILTAVASYKLPWQFEVGARFRLVTGNPTTPVVGAVWDEKGDGYQAIDGAYNSGRLPAFHQLDLRVDRRFVFNRWMFSAYLDVQNVYNRANPEGVLWNHDYTRQTLQAGLPVIPSLGVRAEF